MRRAMVSPGGGRLLIDRLDQFRFLFFGVRNSATQGATRVNFADTLDYFLQLIAGCSGTYGTAALTECPATKALGLDDVPSRPGVFVFVRREFQMAATDGIVSVTHQALTVTTLPIDCISPNSYNPNEMTETGFDELVAEVRKLGRLPKPVVVRADSSKSGYKIVDGEHSWRAAKEVGFEKIECEIVEVDDFEAMSQTYKRNQHGSHNPVKLGQMFEKMCSDRLVSIRKLARTISVSEGTVRNAINYARAARLRSGYAFETLNQDQVRLYLRLPCPINDLWLDSGARISSIQQALSVTLGKEQGKRGWKIATTKDDRDGVDFFEFLCGGDLYKTIDPDDFVATTQRAFRLMEWQFKYRIENFQAYVSIVAELRLEPNILELIPIASSPNTDNKYSVLVSPEKWRDMLTGCLRSKDPEVQYAIAASARHLALKELGWTEFDANDPRKIQRRQIIDEAPDFIKQSELEDHDKVYIADAYVPGVDDAIVMEAKRIAVERLENIKKVLQHGNPDQLSQLGPILQLSVERILNDSLRDAVEADQKRNREHVKIAERKRVEEIFSRPQELADAIKQKLASTSLNEWQINNRPALDVLLSRICSLPTPELKLIAAHLIDHKELSLKVWFDSMRDEHEVERTNKQSTLTDTK
jgi:ParB/RepB/Spo0J family partition protein